MKTSARGIAFLKRHEGVKLTAYRCPAGVWTIGAGLTAATGVVTPRAGMTITAEEADRLLARALVKYEAAVARAMPGASQVEFDAGVSFHFNTGAIGRAQWVAAWRSGDWAETERRLTRNWITADGQVMRGLQRRRAEEFALLRSGDYADGGAPEIPAEDLCPGAETAEGAEAAQHIETEGAMKSLKIPAGGWKTYAVAAVAVAVALLEGPVGVEVPGVTLEDNWLLLVLGASGLATLRHAVAHALDRWLGD